MPRSCILILLDGLGDRSYASLNGKTPLQAAATPHLDRLATMGANGLFWAIRPGLSLPSENAHFSIFGYEQSDFPGRGYLEAAGADIALDDGEVALLAHFASLAIDGEALQLVKHRPQATTDEAEALSRLIADYHHDGITINYHPTHGLDGIVTMKGDVKRQITDSDPLELNTLLTEVEPWLSFANDIAAQKTAKALNSYLLWCHNVLADNPINAQRLKSGGLPVNGLVTQRSGQWLQVEPFSQRWGLKGLSIASSLMYWGLSSFLGMDSVKVKDSKDPGEDLAQRLRMAVQRSKEYQFIHVHTKAPDAAAHSKSPENKVAAIESLDRGLGRVMQEIIDDELIVVVTADHSTPSSGPLVHSGESVPFTVIGQGIRRDTVSCYDEVSCAAGGLGTLNGADFMYLVLNWLERAKLQGLMDTPVNQPFWPGKRQPLKISATRKRLS